MRKYNLHRLAADIVRDAGGQLIGRTRLQKITYLAQLAGFGDDFPFEYRHYGPFSEELASAMEIASGLRLVTEEERRTDWGGWYSIYRVGGSLQRQEHRSTEKSRFIEAASEIGAIELELAATAAFLYAEEGVGHRKKADVWAETARRKPEKADQGRLERAKAAYKKLMQLSVPRSLPPIV